MLVYFIMLFSCMVFAGLSAFVQRERKFLFASSGHILTVHPKNIFFFLSFMPLFLVSAMRYMIGIDYNSYAWIFTAITKTNEKTHVEIGYELLNRIVGFFTNDFIWVFVASSFIIILFFALAIRQNSAFPPLSLFLFISLGYYFYSFNSIRHFIALSLFCFAIKYMRRQELVRFLIVILLASTFHKIALVAIPIYFIFSLRLKFSYYIILGSLLLIMAVLNKQILNLIFTFVYQSYKGSVYNVYDFSAFNVLLSAFACFFAIAYYKPLLKKAKSNIIFINSALFMLMFYLTCWWIPTPSRIGHFGTILFIFLIPEAISCEKSQKLRRFYYILTVVVALAFLLVMLEGAKNPNIKLVPYRSIFDR